MSIKYEHDGVASYNYSSFTTNFGTGCDALAADITIEISKKGPVCEIYIPKLTSANGKVGVITSTKTIPVNLRPATDFYAICATVDNNTNCLGCCKISTSGVITFYKSIILGNFTATAHAGTTSENYFNYLCV